MVLQKMLQDHTGKTFKEAYDREVVNRERVELDLCDLQVPYFIALHVSTGTLPNIRNTLNKKLTRHSGPRIAANSGE